MMPMKENLHSHATSSRRPRRGCLPFFCLLSFAALGVLVWYAPVRMPEQPPRAGIGVMDYRNDAVTDALIIRRSPLQLPFFGAAADARIAESRLPEPATPGLQAPPPLGDVPAMPESAVLNRDEMLRLPPGLQPAPQTEQETGVQP